MTGIVFATTPKQAVSKLKLVSEKSIDDITMDDDESVKRQELEESWTI